MYVVTFYSFKGGVGRTMGLVNVACALKARGQRVLLVDFDLEAPGLPTFRLFESAADTPGIVEYVTEYVERRQAPDVAQFVTKAPHTEGTGEIFVMPAGRQDSSYAARLSAIDWQALYAERDGFLMFEDMKAQWAQSIRPDYVLIDSRTGHTDVGGICTRQLPDAVAVMFFPNDQNIRGLKTVIDDIRAEAAEPRRKSITLHFVPSNVPELDDEEGILHARFDQSEKLLGYSRPGAVIHHYNSLSLLDQVIFVQNRSGSRLAREYLALVNAIVSENMADRNGAKIYLESLLKPDSSGAPVMGPMVLEKLDAIEEYHVNDGEILFKVAAIRLRAGDREHALALLNAAIGAGYSHAEAFRLRTVVNRLLDKGAEAVLDIKSMLASSDAGFFDVLTGVRGLLELQPEELRGTMVMRAINSLDPSSRVQIAKQLMSNRHALPVGEEVLRGVLEETAAGSIERRDAITDFACNLIGQRKYQETIDLILENDTPLTLIQNRFNLAVARWGRFEVPQSEDFQRVIEADAAVDPRWKGANYQMCLAIAMWVVGRPEMARDRIRIAKQNIRDGTRMFSPWRYLDVTAPEFKADLEAIERSIDGPVQKPRFMRDFE